MRIFHQIFASSYGHRKEGVLSYWAFQLVYWFFNGTKKRHGDLSSGLVAVVHTNLCSGVGVVFLPND